MKALKISLYHTRYLSLSGLKYFSCLLRRLYAEVTMSRDDFSTRRLGRRLVPTFPNSLMSQNVYVSFYLFFTDLISSFDPYNLYAHVMTTTQRLGIPTPARAHVKKIGDGTVFIEQVSCPKSVRSNTTVLRLAADNFTSPRLSRLWRRL